MFPASAKSLFRSITFLSLVCSAQIAGAQGQLDGSFASGSPSNGLIYCVAAQPDGKVLVGGSFTFFDGVAKPCLVRLKANGSVDTSFDVGTGANGPIDCIVVKPDGNILIGGEFTTYRDAPCSRIAQLNADGTVDGTFQGTGGTDGTVHSIALDDQGRIYVAGGFNHFQGLQRFCLARLNPNGSIETGFIPDTGEDPLSLYTVAAYPTGGCIIGGSSTVDGAFACKLARLNYDGTLNTTFDAGGTGPSIVDEQGYTDSPIIETVTVRANGSILVGGQFNRYNGIIHHGLVSVNPDGTVDNSFTPPLFRTQYTYSVVEQGDGTVLVKGAGLVRLNSDGTLDEDLSQSFSSAFFYTGYSAFNMAVQSDGKVLITAEQYFGTEGQYVIARICQEPEATWYPDPDGDGYGSPTGQISTCGHPAGYADNNTDDCPSLAGRIGDGCDDGEPATIFDVIGTNCVCTGTAPVSAFPWTENFTSGQGGFIRIDAGQVNKWCRGTAIGQDAPAMYISNNGSANQYTTSSASIAHLVRDLQLPSDATAITLNFSWTGSGQPSADYLTTWLVPTTFFPTAGQAITATGSAPTGRINLTGNLSGSSTWISQTCTIPQAYAGQSVRLVFEWRNDPAVGAQSPAAIDNISVCATTSWYADADADGFGDPNTTQTTCGSADHPVGYVKDNTDNCPALVGKAGSTCTDGDPLSVGDAITLNCTCSGVALPWNEDFSNGPGGFIADNGTQPHQWSWGHAIGRPQPALYISQDGGTTYSYVDGAPVVAPTVVHAYHDIPVIPATATSIWFGFDRLGQVDPAADGLSVWLVPTSFTPQAGVAITAQGNAPDGRVRVTFPAGPFSGWQVIQITLPLAYTGHSARLVFQWKDDGINSGVISAQLAAAIDNIHLCVITPTSGDADGDGIADCFDACPSLANLQNGDACDDGNAGTANDIVTNCVCAGTPQLFGAGNIVVLQAGDGSGALASTGNPIVLHEFTPTGAAGASITIPSTDNAGTPCIIGGTSTTEGDLSLSADGTKLVFGGYGRQLPNTDVLATTTSFSVPRLIATIDPLGTYAIGAVSGSTLFNAMNIRGAVCSGTDFWGTASNQGVNSIGSAPTRVTVASGKTNLRATGIFNGQLYVSSAVTGGTPAVTGIFAVGNGTPTTAGQALTTVVNTNSTSTNGFYFSPSGNVLYVTIGAGGIQKWVHTSSWSLAYTLTFSDGANNLAVDFSGSTPILYVVSNADNKLLKIADHNTGSGSIAVLPSLLATAPNNTAWRGIAFAPQLPCAPVLWYGDLDGDGFGDPNNTVSQCAPAPAGFVADHTDNCPQFFGRTGSTCDDGNSATVNDVVTANCNCAGTLNVIHVAVHMFLEGPFNATTGLMNDALRLLPGFPLTEPYTAIGYVHTGGGGGETIASSRLTVIGNDAIVDWVVVELRSAADLTLVLRSRSALLQRDGDVVDVDGTSQLAFTAPPGDYYVAVRHRNHMGAMLASTSAFGAATVVVDLASPSTITFGTNAQKNVGGTMLLWAGDVDRNGVISYTGTGNDRDPILQAIGSTVPTNTVAGYRKEDTNLDGAVKYTGSGNDRDGILQNIGSTVPTAVRTQQLP